METDASRIRCVVYPGRSMMNQFVPCFSCGVGVPDMPEWQENARHRRGPAAPRIELVLWARIMTRRVWVAIWFQGVVGFVSKFCEHGTVRPLGGL
eukprot:550470-Pyramimonas_sp.AAC.1